jgi:hypothetical protein
MASNHILLVGDLTFKKITEDNALDFIDDRSKCLEKVIEMARNVNMLRHIDMLKQLRSKTDEASGFLDFYNTSTKYEKLGMKDTRYKVALISKVKITNRNKFYTLLGLKCIHSSSLIAKNY